MQRAVARISIALLPVFLFCIPSKTQNEKPSAERIWFAVEERPRGWLRVEPIAKVNEGELVRVPTACSEEISGSPQAAPEFLQPGQIYSVVYGGAAAGEVRVVNRRPNSLVSDATYEGPLKIQGRVKALATNQPPDDFRVESRLAPTREEKAAALVLAREIFRRHGVPSELLSKVHADFLTRTVMAPSPMTSWVGEFTLETAGPDYLQHNLFLIATQGAERLEAELVWIRLSERMDEDEAAEFVDHADLFGDGRDEVVVRLTSTENHRYVVYRKDRDSTHWEQIFMTEPLECP